MSTGEPKAAAPAAAAEAAEAPDLLSQVIAATRPQTDQEATAAQSFFRQFLDQLV
jgi:hypothetical protein